MTAVDAPLAALPTDATHPSSLRHSMTNGDLPTPVRENSDAMSTMSTLDNIEARCGGCRKIIDQDNGGIVVAFGTSLWHVDCFRCAKCKDKVSADTNLLLLSDGSPVCGNCSYQCFVCKQAITEEAIMTGDESYHAHCFTCRTCKRRIEELVFAKTTQGIYCMNCHNERVARSRRHAEAKRQRAKEKEREEAAKGLSTSASLPLLSTVAASSPGPDTPTAASPTVTPGSSIRTERGDKAVVSPKATTSTSNANERTPTQERIREGSVDRSLGATSPVPRAVSPGGSRKGSAPSSPSLDAPPMMRGLSADKEHILRSGTSSPTPPSHTAPLSPPGPTSPSRTPVPLRSPSTGVGLGLGPASGLGVPTSKADKRRSINPGMMFNMDSQNATFAAEPRAPSPLRASFSERQHGNGASAGPSTPALERGASPSLPSPKVSVAPVLRAASPAISPDKTPLPGLAEVREDADKKADATVTRHKEATGNNDRHQPRIDAPSLPTMSFSLSDPDFAVLLSETEANGKTPEKASPPKSNSKTQASPPREDSSTSSSPSIPTISDPEETPLSIKRQSMTRSPQMNLLSSAANGDAASSSSPLRSLLSPHDQPIGTRRRRLSMESTMSFRMEPDSAISTLKELIDNAKPGDDNHISVNLSLLADVVREHEAMRDAAGTLKQKYTGAKRSSQQYSEGLTIAGEEYDKEAAMRRDLEAEVTRLRAQVHGQSARLSLISSDERRQEALRRRSQDLASSLTGLERDISRLRAQRDITLAEVEELQAKSTAGADGTVEETTTKLGRSLTRRLDTIKEQYREELGPLSAQREALQREINDLRETREQFLEESASLAAKNEELAELNAQLSRQGEDRPDTTVRQRTPSSFGTIKPLRTHPSGSPSLSSLSTSVTLQDVPEETARVIKVPKPEPIEAAPARRFKWYKSSKGPEGPTGTTPKGGDKDKKFRPSTEMGLRDHQFQQHTAMRLGRCELCQEKMWGLQEVKCMACGTVCHSKCAEKLPRSCPGPRNGKVVEDEGPPPPSMFGRDLSVQAESDKHSIPVIVTKCIEAVEANGMEYEGIYRKTGGSSQSKQITSLFERGNYESFDLTNVDHFNDISSITSVLKTYFRQLPDPLLTHSLHESFVAAANIRDPNNKSSALRALLKELPQAHYATLKFLMLHLHRVAAQSQVNLMTSQNLGVVFGPTLLRSADPNREFGDMAGKALSVQWMVDHAPTVFVDRD
ncbi:Rho-type gtpase-activating protein [Vanrija albida]|uniref:Rho-type gtpase-activating protein n=1 Tax=Vanrija albida TaxID=181172 RepID=A0ABR3QEB3_9TREE